MPYRSNGWTNLRINSRNCNCYLGLRRWKRPGDSLQDAGLTRSRPGLPSTYRVFSSLSPTFAHRASGFLFPLRAGHRPLRPARRYSGRLFIVTAEILDYGLFQFERVNQSELAVDNISAGLYQDGIRQAAGPPAVEGVKNPVFLFGSELIIAG